MENSIDLKRINFFNTTLLPSHIDLEYLKSYDILNTQVNRMYRSRRVLAIGGKQRIFGLDMVCIETILFHLESF